MFKISFVKTPGTKSAWLGFGKDHVLINAFVAINTAGNSRDAPLQISDFGATKMARTSFSCLGVMQPPTPPPPDKKVSS